MKKRYGIFQVTSNGIQDAKGWNSDTGEWLYLLRCDSEKEVLEVLKNAYGLTENAEYVILPIYQRG